MQPVHIVIFDADGRVRSAFEFEANSWADQLAGDEKLGESIVAYELIEAVENDRIVRVRPGEFHPR
jgi:hypothetical protein